MIAILKLKGKEPLILKRNESYIGLMIDDIVSDNSVLTLPHPKMHLREFVIFPLCEIAPNAIHPLLRSSIEDIKNNLTN